MLDEIDRRILSILQGDADVPVAEVARRVGVSSSPCWRRIKRMESLGVVMRRVVLVNREMVNVPLNVFVSVRAPSHSVEWSEAFGRVVGAIPEIVEAYRLAGETDYLLRIVVPSIQAYDQVYKSMIARLEFRDISSSISMEELKFTTAVPLGYMDQGVGHGGRRP